MVERHARNMTNASDEDSFGLASAYFTMSSMLLSLLKVAFDRGNEREDYSRNHSYYKIENLKTVSSIYFHTECLSDTY